VPLHRSFFVLPAFFVGSVSPTGPCGAFRSSGGKNCKHFFFQKPYFIEFEIRGKICGRNRFSCNPAQSHTSFGDLDKVEARKNFVMGSVK
jgi:hypothetical protein